MAIGTQAARKGEGPNFRQLNAQREAEGLETSAKVWEMKKAGMSFRQIGEQLEMSQSGAHEAYKRVIKRLKDELTEAADDWIHLHIGRLEDVAAFQVRVMKGMDVRAPEVKRQMADAGVEDPPIASLPSLEERLVAARELVKTGESLRKLLGIDAPERSEVDVKGIVGTVDLTELAGAELLAEADALGAGLRTLAPDAVKELVAGKPTEGSEPSTIGEPTTEAQPQEV